MGAFLGKMIAKNCEGLRVLRCGIAIGWEYKPVTAKANPMKPVFLLDYFEPYVTKCSFRFRNITDVVDYLE